MPGGTPGAPVATSENSHSLPPAASFAFHAAGPERAETPKAAPKAVTAVDPVLTCLNAPPLDRVSVLPSHRNPEADKWGDITVAQPKIWEFERVSSLLDGLLRDVEGISLGDLTQLDPSQQNAAALSFIQSALEVGVQYDQAAAVNNSNVLSSYNALHTSQVQQLDQYNNYMQTLTSERDRLASQYSAASNEVNALSALKAAGTITDAQNTQLENAVSRQASTQASLASVNSLISGAGAAPTLTPAPTVTGTSVQGPASGSSMSSSLSGFADVIKNLPQGVQNNLSAALQSPSYPATKRLDNFITLLYERLAREVSVLQDDLTRDPENVAFLLQFDVGLYPSKKAKDHVARVEFNLDCPGCKVYSLYPGQSSYNLANYSGASKRTTLWGNVLTLFGFGLSASYRRQTDMLQGSLVQSVYTAGFQNGILDEGRPPVSTREKVDASQAEQSFGWYYGTAPFEQLVTPGIRSTFALITVPRDLIRTTQDRFGNTNACIPFHIDAGWASRNDPLAQDSYKSWLGSGLKQARIPFYRPTRTELYSESDSGTEHDKMPARDCSSTGDKSSNSESIASPCTWRPAYDVSVLKTKTSVQLPTALDGYSLISIREKQKLHIVRMEYDTVYEDPDALANTTLVQTTVQTNTQSTNPSTGQTTGQTTSQTTGTAVAVSNPTTAVSGASNSTALSPLPCPKRHCAPILLMLDRPIDPNLAVTVNGAPLMRVRDWRGRATSVLPPAQSGTDLSASASAAGSLTLKQLQQTRSLMETDQFGPNTWFAVNSHELLLNVSVDVATDVEFPVIQLADPSGSAVIPHDLRRSFTELIVNNFRMRPETEQGIQVEVARQNWRDSDALCLNDPAADPAKCVLPIGSKDAPISSGLYPFSTYSPLFSPEPAPRKFFASMGETGEDLLIGFLPRSLTQKGTDRTPRFDWLGAQTRVILEDRDQDFAWSLSCVAQGDLLACRIPNDEIARTYLNFLRACPGFTVCPGLEADYRSLLRSLANKASTMTQLVQGVEPVGQLSASTRAGEAIDHRVEAAGRPNVALIAVKNSLPPVAISSSENSTSTVGLQESNADAIKEQAEKIQSNIRTLLSKPELGDLKNFHNAFLSTMQVWVEQFDEEGKNVFYSPEPVNIGFFPISDDYWSDAHFKPWDFLSADSDSVTLRECNYLPTSDASQKDIKVSLLGVPTWKPDWISVTPESGRCGTFAIPTAALANNPIVFQMQFPQPSAAEAAAGVDRTASVPLRATINLPRFRVAPSFDESQTRVEAELEAPTGNSDAAPGIKGWTVTIPVRHTTCFDQVEKPDDLSSIASQASAAGAPAKSAGVTQNEAIRFEWLAGRTPLESCPSVSTSGSSQTAHIAEVSSKWKKADEAGRINLSVEIPRAALKDVPESLHILRTTSDGVTWSVATLPDLRRMLLPSHLKIYALGPTQFAIRGEHAEVIDEVSLQNMTDGTSEKFPTIPGINFALVILPAPDSTKAAGDTSGNAAGGSTNSTQISIVTSKDNTDSVKMTQSNASTPAKAAAAGSANQSGTSKTETPKPLAAGNYAVIPLMLISKPAADPKKVADAKKLQAAANDQAKKVDTAIGAAKKDEQNKLTVAKQKASDAAKNAQAPPPVYMPLDVSDEKGKPLVFTIADTKKTTATTPGNTSPAATTCVAPCAALPCAVTCPPSSAPSTAPKTP